MDIEAFINAVKVGDVARIQRGIDDGVNVNAEGLLVFRGEAPLIMAVGSNNLEVLNLLLDNGCIVDRTESSFGGTALMRAAMEGHVLIAQELINRGAKIDRVNNFDRSSLLLACENGHVDMVKLLIQHNANVNKHMRGDFGYKWTPLMIATIKGYTSIVESLLNHDVSVVEIEERSTDGKTALLWACENAREDVLRVLVSKGARIDVCDYNNKDALMCAVESPGDTHECVRLLLKKSLANSSDCVRLGGDVYKRQNELMLRVFQ